MYRFPIPFALSPSHMSDEGGAEMLPSDGRLVSPSAAAPLEDDNLLGDILFRLPLQPSALPRVSLVCKPWRRLATDAAFLRRFRAHHRNPPLLGLFGKHQEMLEFTPVLDPPDRIPPEAFSLRVCADRQLEAWSILGCRHGRVLIFCWKMRQILVFDPVSGDRRTVPVPPEFLGAKRFSVAVNGAVLCAAGDDDPEHVHGSCHRSPFKVVLVGTGIHRRAFARIYSSDAGTWGDLVRAAEPCTGDLVTPLPCTLVGNSLYWWLTKAGDGMLEFDLDTHGLDVIKKPPYAHIHSGCSRVISRDNGGVGLAVLSYPSFEIWDRTVDSHGAATWMLHQTFNIHQILGMPHWIFDLPHEKLMTVATLVGYSEDTDAVFISEDRNMYMFPLVSMEPTKLSGNFLDNSYHPFTKFYTAGIPLRQLPADENCVWADATAQGGNHRHSGGCRCAHAAN